MELNAEQIKKALECCKTTTPEDCIECPYRKKGNSLYVGCVNTLVKDALALITSQEQRIKELEAETKRLESLCVSKDIIIGDLSKENERLRAIPEQMKERLQAYFGTYVLGYKIPITEALKAVNQIAKEMLEGKDEIRD